MDNNYPDTGDFGEQMHAAGVELRGETETSELGRLEAADTPGPNGKEDPDDLHSEQDGNYLDQARGLGDTAKEAGTRHIGETPNSELGTMTPPETPKPPTPDQV